MFEVAAAGVDRDFDGLLSDISSCRDRIVLLTTTVFGEINVGSIGLGVVAMFGTFARVGPVSLQVCVMVLVIFIGSLGISTVTAIFPWINTVNKLLHGKGDETAAKDGIGTLDSLSPCVGPA